MIPTGSGRIWSCPVPRSSRPGRSTRRRRGVRVCECRNASTTEPEGGNSRLFFLLRFVRLGIARELTMCERTTLAPYIPGQDLNSAKLHDGSVPWYLFDRFIAITRGNDIYFRPGAYNPGTAGGLALLGHELVHVGQYRQGATWLSFVFAGALHGYEKSPLETPGFAMERRIRRDLQISGQACGGGAQ